MCNAEVRSSAVGRAPLPDVEHRLHSPASSPGPGPEMTSVHVVRTAPSPGRKEEDTRAKSQGRMLFEMSLQSFYFD